MSDSKDERTFEEAVELLLASGYASGSFSAALQRKERLFELSLEGMNGEPAHQIRAATKHAILEILGEQRALLTLNQEAVALLHDSAERMMEDGIVGMAHRRPEMRAHGREGWYAAFREFTLLLDSLPEGRVARERMDRLLKEKAVAIVCHSDVTRLLVHEINMENAQKQTEDDPKVPLVIGIPSSHKPENPSYVLLQTDYFIKEEPRLQHALRFLDN